jgi:hypothetical protein
MKSLQRLSVACCIVTVAGCASSGVIPMDHGTFMITKRSAQFGIGMPVGAKADVYTEANEFCGKQGQTIETVSFEMNPSQVASPGNVTLQFRCVPK